MLGEDALSDAHRALLDSWFAGWEVVADHSWPLQDTTVLRIRADGGDFIVKASRTSHHIDREIAAHRSFLSSSTVAVPRLVHADVEEKILVATYLPGELVAGTAAEWAPTTYRKAGQVLDTLLVPGEVSPDYVDRLRDRGLRSVADAAGLVPAGHLDELRKRLTSTVSRPVRLSFTHGDYHPRNWLLHNDEFAVIDFGRAEQRHWTSDLVRLQSQQFAARPDLAAAFTAGLGREFGEEDIEVLALEWTYQAITTVVWAHEIGDSPFEEHGRRMIARMMSWSTVAGSGR
ncbi:phosphotransferase family protein [Nocardia flavorosea]|uniref:phosphotransferase family protein n=1 Tax=Nocardia flavorosea TaxID=53429 RepID=UPI000AF32C1C|nr:aminoglycoside phosphotransferase family protein [Nocardia flavorosea]